MSSLVGNIGIQPVGHDIMFGMELPAVLYGFQGNAHASAPLEQLVANGDHALVGARGEGIAADDLGNVGGFAAWVEGAVGPVQL